MRVGTLDIDTLELDDCRPVEQPETGIGLTVLAHPDLSRIGESALITPLLRHGPVNLSRSEPLFSSNGAREPRSLQHPVISRQGIAISVSRQKVSIDLGQLGHKVRVSALASPLPDGSFPASELEYGITIDISGCVLLLLHTLRIKFTPTDGGSELVGGSVAICDLRAEIVRVAESDTGVLIRGETGTGKELVARAIHRSSKRRAEAYLAVNMAAVPETMAASVLFGHERGAFTGAVREHVGYFAATNHGTLFLDEVGETSKTVQGQLLRVLREGEIQPVGGAGAKKVDVRVLAATDAPLEDWVAQGRFSDALLRRLEAYTIIVPPLRHRRDDIARLFALFLRKELTELGDGHRFAPVVGDARPWLPASFVQNLLDYRWPGNVAELQSVARRVAIANRGADAFRVDEWVRRRLLATASPDSPATKPPDETPPKTEAAHLNDAEIVSAMRRCRFVVREAAEHLGVSRSWLHTRLEFCKDLRQAKDLTPDEIRRALRAANGSTTEAAAALEVSEHGLKLRITALKLATAG